VTRARVLLLLLLAPGGCAIVARGPSGSFAVKCNVGEAAVLVDDVLVGRVSEWAPPGRPIRPGFHRIEIRHPGYFSHYSEVEVADGRGAEVAAELHPLLD
jgi:hypothetical protein